MVTPLDVELDVDHTGLTDVDTVVEEFKIPGDA